MIEEERLTRLREMSREPERQAMSRGVQFPSLAHQHLADEQEIVRLRSALGEAVAIIDGLRIQLREPPRDGGDL